MKPFSLLLFAAALSAQTPAAVLGGYEVTALVLAGHADGTFAGSGTAIITREDGVLLTALHLVKDAYALQVRLKSGEVFDDVQLLGTDPRRNVAALKISARQLPVLPVVKPTSGKPGEPVTVIFNATSLPSSASSATGTIVGVHLADQIPGAGTGYTVIQFAPGIAPGASGGLLMDSPGNALGLIVGGLPKDQPLNFAIPLTNLLGLADRPPQKSFASGASIKTPGTEPPTVTFRRAMPSAAAPDAPAKSDALRSAKDRETILRECKTLYINTDRTQHFGSEQLKVAFANNKDFPALGLRIVENPKLADVILKVGYTFAWDFPFELLHQNTSLMLIAGKGTGPFSGPAGATSVAREFVKLMKPFRTP